MFKISKSQLIAVMLFCGLGVGLFYLPQKSKAEKENKVDRSVDVAINEAISLINEGGEPMKGILKLREIADKNPENMRAQFQLGLLSIKSGQFEKAIDRFKVVLEKDSMNDEVLYYLGHTYAGVGNNILAEQYFQKSLKVTENSELKEEIKQYLYELKKQ